MTIVINGGGSIGFIIGEYFSHEGHDVTIIEPSPTAVKTIQDRLDVNVVLGNGTNIQSLKNAGIEKANMFLAVTDNDEANMISCAFAKSAGVPFKLARLNASAHLSKESVVALKGIGVDEVLDSEKSIIHELEKIIAFPGFADIKHFMDNSLVVSIFSFNRASPFYGQPVKNIPLPKQVVPFGYTKVSDFQEYDPETRVSEFLYVYYACPREDLPLLHSALAPNAKKIRRVMIFGEGYKSEDMNIELADTLQKTGVSDVTLVLDRHVAAEKLSERTDLPVILGDPTKPLFGKNEQVSHYDAFIAISSNFEKNLFACSVAYKEKVSYTYSLVRYPEHVNFVSAIPLTSFINPAMVVANRIMRHHQADFVTSRAVLNYGQAECLEYTLPHQSKIAGKKISDIGLIHSKIIMVRRGNSLIIPEADFVFAEHDRLLICVISQEWPVLKKILAV